MCLNKLKVRNKKVEDSSFNPLIDRFYNYVPCNKCEDCIKLNQSSYRVRAVFEYLSTKKNGGRTFFYTLTYNEQKIPRYKGKPCFDVSLVQRFLKRLRKFLSKEGYSLKYFLSSEVGDNTFRPHHHVLFYLDKKYPAIKFKKLIESTWWCGFIKVGQNNGVVFNLNPCNYVAKYVTKDTNYFEYLKSNDIDVSFLQEFEEFKYFTKDSRTFKPFHLQSVGFGLGMFDYINDSSLVDGFIVLNTSDGVSTRYPIPLYITRKLLYNICKNDNGNVVYRLNERGVKVRKEQLFNNIKKLSIEFASLFSLSKTHFKESYLMISQFPDYNEFYDYVLSVLHGDTSFDDLAAYYLLYHDLPFYQFKYLDLKSDIDSYYNCILYSSDIPFIPPLDDNHLYDFFVGYDLVINCLFDLKKYFAYEKYKKLVNNYNALQFERSSVSNKKPKLIKLKCFQEFIDKNFNSLCSITLPNKTKKLLEMNLIDLKSLRPSMMSLF